MKYLLLVAALGLSMPVHAVNEDSLRFLIKCIEGYKFLIVYSVKTHSAPTVTQVYKEANGAHASVPFTCKAVDWSKYK